MKKDNFIDNALFALKEKGEWISCNDLYSYMKDKQIPVPGGVTPKNTLSAYLKRLTDRKKIEKKDINGVNHFKYKEEEDFENDESHDVVNLDQPSSNMPFDINVIIDTISATGLIFDPKFVQRYLCSLLTKPFVILSGLTGSGKTQLAMAFPKLICEDKSQYKLIPVGADWTNREQLLGYPNALRPGEYVMPDNGALQLILEASKPENQNRFVKFVLNSFLGFCLSIRSNKHAQERLKREADEVCQQLFQYLAHPLFRRLGNLTTMPLGSPTLQKRAGYREILQKWLMFDMAAKLTWDGGEDVYSAGQKNVARLYEYWLFFKLLKEFSRKFRIQPIEKSKLLQVTEGHLGLCLKEGKMQVMHGTYTYKGRKLNMVFAYNRTFAYTKDYEKSGSWSQQMRPDYTLSVWPGDIENPEDVERQDLITHIHFDAKYRVDNLINEFRRGADVDLSDIKHEEERGTYKRADLLKMHAYKDAIKRSAGAYVLYPGTENPDPFLNFHEIIPGLGAFAISPRNSNVSYFLKFIDDVIENFLNRTSQRERMQHHRYQDLQVPGISVFDELPEPKDDERTLPDETFVLVGYTREENTAWIGDKMLYPARIGAETNGSIILDKNVVSARYPLSYNATGQKLFKIDAAEGLKIVTKQEIASDPYKYNSPNHENYMLSHLKPAEKEFDGLSFNINQLNEKLYNKKEIFAVDLVTLMNNRK